MVNTRSTACLGIYIFVFCVGRHEPDGLRGLGTWIMENTLTHSSSCGWIRPGQRGRPRPLNRACPTALGGQGPFPSQTAKKGPAQLSQLPSLPPCPMPRTMGHAHMAAHVPRNAQHAIKPRRPWCKHCHVVSCGVLCYAPAPSCLTCLNQARRVR